MKLTEKLELIKRSLCLTDKELFAKYKIKNTTDKSGFKTLTDDLGLDLDDFFDDSSSISKTLKPGEHECRLKSGPISDDCSYEDFAREDNSRYEERD